MRHGNRVHQGAQGIVDADGREVRLHEVLRLEEREDGLVGIVGEEFARLGDTLGVNGVSLEDTGGPVGYGRCKDQWQKKLVTA